MIDQCDQCGEERSSFSSICPRCGKRFGGSDDLLQRSANAPAWSNQTPSKPIGWSDKAMVTPIRKTAPWIRPTSAGALFLVVCLIGWGGYSLWMTYIGYYMYNSEGNAAFSAGDRATALDDYSKMIALRPGKVDGYVMRGIAEDQTQMYSSAVRDYTTGLTTTNIPIVRGDLFYDRAEAEGSEGRTKQTITDYNLANAEYEKAPYSRSSHDLPNRQKETDENLAYYYNLTSDYNRAVKASRAAFVFEPDDDYAYVMRGEAELGLGQNASALRDFNYALRLKPGDATTLAQIGRAVDHVGSYDVAVTALTQAAQNSPNSIGTWGSLGWYQYQAGQFPQAITSDEYALKFGNTPDMGWIRFNLALTYAALGQKSKAQKAYADGLANSRPNDKKGAISDLNNAIAKHPESTVFRAALAQMQATSD